MWFDVDSLLVAAAALRPSDDRDGSPVSGKATTSPASSGAATISGSGSGRQVDGMLGDMHGDGSGGSGNFTRLQLLKKLEKNFREQHRMLTAQGLQNEHVLVRAASTGSPSPRVMTD